MNAGPVTLTVWGCRGSLPVPGTHTAEFGGDTTCYEVAAGTERLIVDCGSGIRALGESLMAAGPPETLDILLTHPHFDHLIGLGFFAPLIARKTRVRLWTALPAERVLEALYRLYSPPLWPVMIPGNFPITVEQIPESGLARDPFRVGLLPLNHPGGSIGYRIEATGRCVSIVTDHEQGDAAIDAHLTGLVRGSDLLLIDAAYSPEEYPQRKGWGHSSWPGARAIGQNAGIAQTLIVHHGPGARDAELLRAERALADQGAFCRFARDGMRITL
ncbi:MAG: MBL fold metallo-hydrolase [Pseudomonadota bacterium]